jgi:hypothetical protein
MDDNLGMAEAVITRLKWSSWRIKAVLRSLGPPNITRWKSPSGQTRFRSWHGGLPTPTAATGGYGPITSTY